MELRQLRYLVAVAEEASFTRGAARVHVAQPAVSQQIAELERELGDKLFDRSDRRVHLTPAGEAFLPYARAALDAALDGRDAIVSMRGVLTGQLAAGTIQSPPEFAVRLLGEFQRLHRAVDLSIRVAGPEALTADVAAGALDVAIIGLTGRPLPAAVATRALATEPLVVAAAPDHPIAAKSSVTLDELRDEPIMTLTHGSGGLRTVLETACEQAGFTPMIRAETDDLTLLAGFARHGLGVALLPQSAAQRAQQPLATATLEPTLTRRTALAWNRRRTSAAGQAFLAFMQRQGPSPRAG